MLLYNLHKNEDKERKMRYFFLGFNKIVIFAAPKGKWFGTLAQSVEQQTENLCVPGSIPGGTTKASEISLAFFMS